MPARANLSGCLKSCCWSQEPLFGEAACFSWRSHHFVPGGVAVGPVLADRSRLARVLDSVLASTAKRSAAGAIELRTSVRDWADGRPRAILTVHDTGRDLESDDLLWMLGSQAVLDVELYVARNHPSARWRAVGWPAWPRTGQHGDRGLSYSRRWLGSTWASRRYGPMLPPPRGGWRRLAQC